ncbi:hypothetical protein E8E12_010339 [Didymella heteroderae]|uniref:Uncharacterized protein n=1 Tax=Didymella heteroderae TaxID=1769908 RepID=A0A9P4WXI0_9PLEO|nr:hypothetical protein E8E12_010339 [Didymella heteroderae]
MCQYWRKLHTCTHPSDRPYIEMCRPGFLSNTVCLDISEDGVLRPSHFPCWACIKSTGWVDAEEKQRLDRLQASAAETTREVAVKARLEAEKKAHEESVRREAREKAERERAAEVKVRAEREREAKRARKEGGAWVLAEAGSGKKKKKGSVPGSPASPASPSMVTGSRKDVWKENGNAGGGKTAWKDEKSEVSGRAGVWGPKKILSRKEGTGVLADRMDAAVGGRV